MILLFAKEFRIQASIVEQLALNGMQITLICMKK